MAGPGTYQLSYDEQQRAKSDGLARSRVQRLLAVRERDRQVARARARSYQALCDESSLQLKRRLIAVLEQQRAAELAALQEQCGRASAGLANAHREAAATAGATAARAEEQRRLIAARAAAAQRRFEAAVAQVRAAREADLRGALDALARREEVMARERAGARAAAAAARGAAAAEGARRAEVDIQEEQRRRRNMHSQIDFRWVCCTGFGLC
jgi:hypothetical protein